MFKFLLLSFFTVFTSAPLLADEAVVSQIDQLIQSNPECYNTQVHNRGRYSDRPGYFRGMIYTMIRSTCRDTTDVIRTGIVDGHPDRRTLRHDTLLHHLGGQAYTSTDERFRMVTNRLLTLNLGMWESSGQYWEGVDVTNSSSYTATTAEAGLFQTSQNVGGGRSSEWSRALTQLEEQYRENPELCMVDVFSQGVTPPQNQRPGVGEGVGREFQELLRTCPAAAAEHIMLTARMNRRHYGPLKRGEARPTESCRPLFNQVYDLSKSQPNFCQAFAIPNQQNPNQQDAPGAVVVWDPDRNGGALPSFMGAGR